MFFFILFLHVSWTFIVVVFILFCWLIYFALNSRFSEFCLKKRAWLKSRNKIFAMYLRKVSLINTFVTRKMFRWSAENRFIKRVHIYMFLKAHVILISQVLCILSECDCMNSFQSSDIKFVKKVWKCIRKQ